MEPGTRVRATYRGQWEGEILPENSVEAWTGTMAFNYQTPTQAQVDAHVKRCAELAEKHGYEADDRVWVRWDFGVTTRIYRENPDRLIVV